MRMYVLLNLYIFMQLKHTYLKKAFFNTPHYIVLYFIFFDATAYGYHNTWYQHD